MSATPCYNTEDRRCMLFFFRNTSTTGHCHEVVPVLNRRNNVDITIAVEARIL